MDLICAVLIEIIIALIPRLLDFLLFNICTYIRNMAQIVEGLKERLCLSMSKSENKTNRSISKLK